MLSAKSIKSLEKYNHLMIYEKEVMKVLLTSSVLAELCKNKEVNEDEISDLKWGNYFPSLFIEDTITDTEAYIMYNFDIEENYIADTYFDGKLVFQVYCHKDILRVPYGVSTRYSAIIAELNRLFDNKNILGIALNSKTSDLILAPKNPKYVGRQVVFSIKDIAERSMENYNEK